MNRPVIVAAKRTAVGKFGGCFSEVSAITLGVEVAKGLINETGINPELIDEVIIGNVLCAGLGQNVARQIQVGAGIPVEKTAFSVSKVCGSGLKSIALAAAAIQNNDADVIIAGGTENMSRAPYLMKSARFGARMGHDKMVDSMIIDGLWDAFNDYHMGMTAENLADQWNISREEIDEFSAYSQNKTENAIKEGRFVDEIVPIHIPRRKGDPLKIDTDEFPKSGVTAESLSSLKPAFKKDGKVTAASSSGINDGAALVLIMSEDKAKELGMNPLAYVKAYASAGVDPSIMGYGPVPAIKKALIRAGWELNDIELIELNEAFAAQSIAAIKGLEKDLGEINRDIINVNGGAISIGHPIGASGARILVTLLHEMKRRNNNRGLASLCIGGGQGIAMLVER